jgi:hypothetical protein
MVGKESGFPHVIVGAGELAILVSALALKWVNPQTVSTSCLANESQPFAIRRYDRFFGIFNLKRCVDG